MTMMINNSMHIFFGNAQTCTISHKSDLFSDFCLSLCNKFNLSSLTILSQNHGIQGAFIDSHPDSNKPVISIFEQQGDYLITNQKKSGIGILTADCVPIIAHDTINNAVSVIHAGWRGTKDGILAAALTNMKQETSTKTGNIVVWFGPAARACCYEVQPAFIDSHFPSQKMNNTIIKHRQNRYFLDLVAHNKLQAENLTVKQQQINDRYSLCTICNTRFHSFRRDKSASLRQLTLAWLV